MSLIELIPPALRPWAIALVLLAIAGAAAGGAWTVQDWRYGQALAEQGRQAAEKATAEAQSATARADAVTAALVIEQAKRVALEGRLKLNDETHHKELSDAKNTQQRLVETAKINGQEHDTWLCHVLERLPQAYSADYEALLPWNCSPEMPRFFSGRCSSGDRVPSRAAHHTYRCC